MKIYRTTVRTTNGMVTKIHSGFKYSLSKSRAKKAHKEEACEISGDVIEELELYMNKWDVIRFLNAHCHHPPKRI